MKLNEYLYQFPEITDASEIVFFSGSFNPWHQGHTTCIELLPSHLPIIIIPDHNPTKEMIKNEQKLTDPKHIIKNVQHLNRNLFIYDEFLKNNQKNPTYDWISSVKQSLPMTKISLLIGYDNLKDIHTWIEADKLLNTLSHIYVASRLERDREHAPQIEEIQKINPQLDITLLGHHKFEHINSTEIRDK